MSHRKLSRNSPCPCGSGKKYKCCCISKGFDWVEDDEGRVSRSVPLSAEAAGILDEQRLRFVDRFGREAGPDAPIFFDAPPVEQMEFQMVQAMKAAGMAPSFIYAYEKTGGLLITEQNMHLIPEADLAAWQAAIDEYEEKHGGRDIHGV